MILLVTSAVNQVTIEQLALVLPKIIKRKIRNSTRRKKKAPKVVEPISRGRKRMRAPPHILAQAPMMSVLTYA